MTLSAVAGVAAYCVGFIVLFQLTGVLRSAANVMGSVRSVLATLGDPGNDELSTERAMQRAAGSLFWSFLKIVLGGAAAFLLPAAFIYGADQLGLLSFDTVLAGLSDWRFLVGATVVALAVWQALRLRRKPEAEPVGDYSPSDQLLHEIAFATRPVQRALGGLEDKSFEKRGRAPSAAPVFIAGLPRAGTTVLLETLEATGRFASHTYRNMPFVLTPLSWNGFARRFGKEGEARERAHGDGMMVDFDSPEAFEEVLWMTFWPQRYQGETLPVWKGAQAPKFERFFRLHREKLVFLREQKTGETGLRYASKNNLNICRIDFLRDRIDDAVVIVPFREPVQHAASLLNQHKNFLKQHQDDAFGRLYMAAIGHFDFGANLKPVNFGGWATKTRDLDPTTLEYWLAYWRAAYGFLRTRAGDRVHLLDYDALCADPQAVLQKLADAVAIDDPQALLQAAPRFRPAPSRKPDLAAVDPDLMRSVYAVYDDIQRAAL
ncbi:MAG: sulfotransferase [Pseudomonadota bacterium]